MTELITDSNSFKRTLDELPSFPYGFVDVSFKYSFKIDAEGSKLNLKKVQNMATD